MQGGFFNPHIASVFALRRVLRDSIRTERGINPNFDTMDGEIMGAGKAMVLKSRTKWLWVGLVLAFFLPPVIGLIYGVSLFFERPYRKEAFIIIGWTIVWSLIVIWWGYNIPGVRIMTPLPNVIY